MFIRRKPNKSGSTSVQIIKKVGRRNRVVKTVGCARNPGELGLLEDRARSELESLRPQLSFSFDMTDRERSVVSLMKGCKVYSAGPELILGSIFDDLGFRVVPDSLFKDIVISRLIYPSSKLRTTEYLLRHTGKEVEVTSIYRFLDKLGSQYKDEVEQVAFNYTKHILNGITVAFYDMTSLYFEAEREDDLRRIGFSKDGKFQHPQILLGLLVGLDGFPISYDIYEGNTFEGDTLIPALEKVQARFDVEKPTIIADSALLSHKNIDSLSAKGYRYIIGARIKNEKSGIRNQILEIGSTLKNQQCDVIERQDGTRLVINFSEARATKDAANREKGLSRLKAKIASGKLSKNSINNRGYNKFLRLHGQVLVDIDEEKVKQDKRWDGLKGYVTNSDLPPELVLANYRQLWKIEKAFRVSKTDLRIRPIFHRKRSRIEAHVCIAFVAYTVFKELENRLLRRKIEISPQKALDIMRTIYEIEIYMPDSKKFHRQFAELTHEQIMLLGVIR